MKIVLLIFLLISNLAFSQVDFNLELQSEFGKESTKVEGGLASRGDWERLGKQTISVGILSVATLGILYALPESITGWNHDNSVSLGDRWVTNVKRGPIWDHDNAFFNYIGHPYVGAVYYVAARKSDFNEFDSFIYSSLMSAFFWEYGIEAFAEVPSIQDLVITPVFGAFLGEYFYQQEIKIIENDGKLLGSRFLGRSTMIFIDPIGTLSNMIGFKDNDVKGVWTFSVDNSGRVDRLGLAFTGNI